MFGFVMVFQLIGIFAYLPAAMAGALVSEKEAGTLDLLLISSIGPYEIVLQKYIARMIPMFALIFASLPMGLLAYSLGGVSSEEVQAGVVLIISICIAVGAVSLLMSALTKTTTASIVCSYISVAGLTYIYLAILEETRTSDIDDVPGVYYHALIPALIIAAVCLITAIIWLKKSPAIEQSGLGRRILRKINDTLFISSHEKTLGFKSLDNRPVFWMNIGRLFSVRGIAIRILVFMAELAGILLISLCASFDDSYNYEASSWFIVPYIVWFCITTLAVIVMGADAITRERTLNTLPVILTTPIEARDVLKQKVQAIWARLTIYVLPLFLLVIANAIVTGIEERNVALYIFLGLAGIFIHLPCFLWFSIWVGLKIKRRLYALITALMSVAVWTVGFGAIIILLIEAAGYYNDELLGFLAGINPALLVIFTALNPRDPFRNSDSILLVGIICGLILHYIFYRIFRMFSLNYADKYMRRDI